MSFHTLRTALERLIQKYFVLYSPPIFKKRAGLSPARIQILKETMKKTLSSFLASLAAAFLLLAAFAAFSPVETNAAESITKSNPLNLFKAPKSVITAPKATMDSECTISGYLTQGYGNYDVIANKYIQFSPDYGASWHVFAVTNSDGYYENGFPATNQTFWGLRVMPAKGKYYQVSYGPWTGSESWWSYCSTAGEDTWVMFNEYLAN